MKRTLPSLLGIATALLLATPVAQATPLAPAVNSELSSRSAAPSGFEENKGQVITKTGETASFVRYRLTQGNTRIFLLGDGIAYQFNRTHYPEGYAELEQRERLDATKHDELEALRKEIRVETYRMDMLLEGANANARITTEGRSTDFTQYYNHSALDVHTYSRVTYHEVYPGIDWVVYTTPKGMKYDFVLRPGADPALIQMRFKGHEELRVDADGQLIHGNRMGRFTEQPPVSFQNGQEVATRFVLKGDRLRFALAAYDRSQPLTIDPDRSWGTYYGGAGYEDGRSCAVDGSDNVYLAGTTTSNDHIAIYGHDYTLGGSTDAFLVKFDGSGVRLWGTFYGGSEYESGAFCATDGNGNVYLAGNTLSSNAIASGGHQNTYAGGSGDAFLVKFNASGVRQWATYYGGPATDNAVACTVDITGNVYMVGQAKSLTGIAFSGHQNTCGGEGDGYLVKFNSAGVRQWATYYGGTGSDNAMSCAVTATGEVYLAGNTSSSNAISYLGLQNTFGGGANDGYLVKFSPSGVRQWATFFGGEGNDLVNACAADGTGNVYLAGETGSTTQISAVGFVNSFQGDNDGFLAKFTPLGVRLWGTYYGGPEYDAVYGCAVDPNGNVYVAGSTKSTSGIASDGFQMGYIGVFDAFLVKFTPNGERLWGSYYGGGAWDDGYACAVDNSGNVYLAGMTTSGNIISYQGHQNMPGGDRDAFLAKFVGGAVGIGTLSAPDHQPTLSIWPNPNTGDRFFLEAQGTGSAEVQLFDALGKLQRTQPIRLSGDRAPVEVALDSELAKGLYMVRVTVEGRSSVAPLMIE